MKRKVIFKLISLVLIGSCISIPLITSTSSCSLYRPCVINKKYSLLDELNKKVKLNFVGVPKNHTFWAGEQIVIRATIDLDESEIENYYWDFNSDTTLNIDELVVSMIANVNDNGKTIGLIVIWRDKILSASLTLKIKGIIEQESIYLETLKQTELKSVEINYLNPPRNGIYQSGDEVKLTASVKPWNLTNLSYDWEILGSSTHIQSSSIEDCASASFKATHSDNGKVIKLTVTHKNKQLSSQKILLVSPQPKIFEI